MNQLVSVIIPVHNEEKNISVCLDSILAQTYKNIEIVISDDASEDDTLKICEEYRKNNPQIHILKSESGRSGPGKTRKKGCMAATGDFACFVDADDYIEPDMIEKMMRCQSETDADIVCCGVWEKYSNGKHIKRATTDQVFSNQTSDAPIELFLQKLFCDRAVASYFCNKMFRMELLHNNVDLISEKECFEDMETIYKLALKSHKTACIKDVCYHYIRRSDDSIMDGWNAEKSRVFMDVYEEAKKQITSQFSSMESVMQGACLIAASRSYKALSKAPVCRENTCGMEEARRYLKEHRKWTDDIEGKEKIQIWMIIYFPLLIKALIKLKRMLFH